MPVIHRTCKYTVYQTVYRFKLKFKSFYLSWAIAQLVLSVYFQYFESLIRIFSINGRPKWIRPTIFIIVSVQQIYEDRRQTAEYPSMWSSR
jgi:hypothetical protein